MNQIHNINIASTMFYFLNYRNAELPGWETHQLRTKAFGAGDFNSLFLNYNIGMSEKFGVYSGYPVYSCIKTAY